MAKPTARKRVWLRRAIPAAVVVLIVGGFVGNRAFASGASTPSYRLGKVTMGSVDQTLTLNGTAQKVNQATVSFRSSGTVKSVPVEIGDPVTAGQTLATLDPTALQRAVTSAEATLAQDQASLANDESGTSSSSTGSTGSTGSSGSTNSGTGGNGSTAANAAYDPVSTSSAVAYAVEAAYVTVAAHPSPPTTKAAAAAAVQAAQAKVTADETTAATNVATLMTDITAQATQCAGLLPDTTPASQPKARRRPSRLPARLRPRPTASPPWRRPSPTRPSWPARRPRSPTCRATRRRWRWRSPTRPR